MSQDRNMITNKEQLKTYLYQDREALMIPQGRRFPRPVYDEIWKYQILLRKAEYAGNCKKGALYLPWRLWRKAAAHRRGLKLGFSIPLNVFGAGLSIAHCGTIVVNGNARIGKNCRIHENVTIGASGSEKAPVIGDNVFIGTGAKIIGDITIADHVVIGAGAVVVKSCLEPGVTIAGNPAKKISENNSRPYIAQAVYGK